MKFYARFSMLLFAVFAVTAIGCQSSPDFEVLKSEILDLHRTTIDAHWNKDAGFFVKNISDDYISVGSGEIRRPSRDEIVLQFKSYLNNSTFTEYRDLQEPIVGFSKDGSVAWSIVQMKVAGRRTLNNGYEKDFDDTWAWITLYERQGDKWIRLAEVSNRK